MSQLTSYMSISEEFDFIYDLLQNANFTLGDISTRLHRMTLFMLTNDCKPVSEEDKAEAERVIRKLEDLFYNVKVMRSDLKSILVE